MRGLDQRSGALFAYVDLEARVRADCPLRSIRQLTDEALAALSKSFLALYAARMGRPSIPLEMLLQAMLLQAFYSIRSERQLMERREFILLLRWFVGLGVDDQAWDHSSFTRNRNRNWLLAGEIAAQFLAAVLVQPRVKRLLSSDHLSVDGTLIEAWASIKSFKPSIRAAPIQEKTRRPLAGVMPRWTSRAIGAQTRRTRAPRTAKPGSTARCRRMEATLCFIGHTLMESRLGLIVDTLLTAANGHAE